ncbi:MAG: anaerobic glycerol-3-phosphate dehydrogenase subunit C [Desulfovibrionaceae bacterium]
MSNTPVHTTELNPDSCIACTICQVHCPVAQASPHFLGPRLVGPAYERFRLLGLGEEESLHYCSNCKNCDIACPHDVPISAFNMRARAAQSVRVKPPFRDWILGHGETIAKLLRFVPAFCKNLGMLNPLTRHMLSLLGISPQAPLPAFAPKSFRAQYKHHAPNRTTPQDSGKIVVFFPGCYIDTYDPRTGLDMVWLLEKAGYTVIVPDSFVCCGLPMVANGFWEDAHQNARRNVSIMQHYAAQNIPVVTGCPSCALMFNSDIPEYFPDLITAEHTCLRMEDAQSFLWRCVSTGQLALKAQSTKPLKVMYHAPCHLRAQGIALPGLELLQALPNVHALDAHAGCCGISGSYGFKKEKYPIGMQVGAELFSTLRASQADYAASECGTCRLQMRHGAHLTSLHPVSIIREVLEG